MSPWSGSGSFSRTNTVHTGATVWEQDRLNGDKIIATRHDSHDQDLADGIAGCLARNGENAPSADLPMGTYKHLNVGAAAARTQYAQTAQVQDSSFVWAGSATGSSSAYAITMTPAIAAYAAGQRFAFVANHANTGATTLNVNTLGAKSVKLGDGSTALSASQIANGSVVEVVYDGTNFRLLNTVPGAGTTGSVLTYLGAVVAVGAAGPGSLINSGGVVTDTTISGLSVAVTLAANETLVLVSLVPFSISTSTASVNIRHWRDSSRCTIDTYAQGTDAINGVGGQNHTLTLVSYDTPGAGSFTYTTKWSNTANTVYSSYPALMVFRVKSS